jgi:hypothetical protein
MGGMHADVNCLSRYRAEAIEAAEADARLIAAAPDLLAALHHMLGLVKNLEEDYGPIEAGAIDLARAALAKAEG